jgi:hypothetical protein
MGLGMGMLAVLTIAFIVGYAVGNEHGFLRGFGDGWEAGYDDGWGLEEVVL